MKLTKPQIRMLSQLRDGQVLHFGMTVHGRWYVTFDMRNYGGPSISTMWALDKRGFIEGYAPPGPRPKYVEGGRRYRITPAGRTALGVQKP